MDIKTFFKKVVGTLENEVKTEVDRAKRQMQSTSSPSSSSQSAQTTSERPVWTRRKGFPTQEEWMPYFREILSQEFGQYEVRENVRVQELVGDVCEELLLYPTRPHQAYKAEWGLPYSFVLYHGGQLKAVILVAKSQDDYRRVKFLISKMYAKKMAIPFISFYMDAPNEREYVVDRIKDFLPY